MRLFIPRQPQHWFATLALIFGICFTFATPLFMVPDELGHMSRAYGISSGNWLATKNNGKSGSYTPDSLKTVADFASHHGTVSTITSLQSTPLVSGKTVFIEHPNLSPYSPLVYAPQAAAFVVARTVHIPAVDSLYLVRIFNVLAYAMLWWVAIRLLPFGKWVGVIVGLLPMHVLLAGSMSADPVSIGLMAVLVAVVFALRTLDRHITTKELWWLVGLAAVVSLTKLPLPLLLLLFLFVPTRVFGATKKEWWRTIGLLAITALLVGGGWLLLASHTLVSYGPANVDPAMQLHSFISNPFDFIKAFAVTFFTPQGDVTAAQYVVSIGFLIATVPLWITYAYTVFIAFAVFPLRTASSAALSRRQKIVLATLVAACFVIIGFLLYLSWTPPGAHKIEGIQARYLTPFILLLIPLLAVKSTKKNEQEGSLPIAWYRWGTLFFLGASLLMSVYFFYVSH